MSVDAVQAAQRMYIHDLQNLKLEIKREMDRAQLGKNPKDCNALERAIHGMSQSRTVVITTIEEHET